MLHLHTGDIGSFSCNVHFLPFAWQNTPLDPTEADVILAAECVWLKDLVEPFVTMIRAPSVGSSRSARLQKRDASVAGGRQQSSFAEAFFSSAGESVAMNSSSGSDMVTSGAGSPRAAVGAPMLKQRAEGSGLDRLVAQKFG